MLFCNGFSGELFKFEANIIGRSNDDGDGNENGKKAIGLDWQNKTFARASRFFVHFLAVAARLQREVPNFTFCRGRERR